jgi:uncharacterized protein (TIGR02594 family)
MPGDPNPSVQKVNTAFNAAAGAWDKEHNLFYHLKTYSDAEIKQANSEKFGPLRAKLRQVMGRKPSQAKLTEEEISLLRDIGKQAKVDAAKYGLDVDVAESLRFASRLVGVDHDIYMKRLLENNGNLRGLDSQEVTKAGPFKFDPESWLYMIKTHGAEHGLKYFADKITLGSGPGGAVTVDVADPTVLREIVSLRDNPRLSAIMGAEYMKHEREMPRTIASPGGEPGVDPVVKRQQQILMRLGFDVGLKGADGELGPLTKAALEQFCKMHKVTNPADVSWKLEAVVRQALDDAKKYTREDRQISAAEAYAMRHASQAAKVPFDHILNIATAERAFEPGMNNPNREPGLFHFRKDKWVKAIAQYGEKYGLGELVRNHMVVKKDKAGHVLSVTIPDPMIRKYILDLRKDPHVSALMGAEYCKTNPVQLDIAECYLGEDERNNKDSKELSTFMQSQKKIGFVSPEDTPWCAAFINATLEGAGIKSLPSLWAKDFLNYGTNVKPGEVKPGDIVVFKNGHVAFVMERNRDGTLKVIGGNQGIVGSGNNGYVVNIKERGEDSVEGYRRPPPALALKNPSPAAKRKSVPT